MKGSQVIGAASVSMGRNTEILEEYYKLYSEADSQSVGLIPPSEISGLALSGPSKKPKTAAVNSLVWPAKVARQGLES